MCVCKYTYLYVYSRGVRRQELHTRVRRHFFAQDTDAKATIRSMVQLPPPDQDAGPEVLPRKITPPSIHLLEDSYRGVLFEYWLMNFCEPWLKPFFRQRSVWSRARCLLSSCVELWALALTVLYGCFGLDNLTCVPSRVQWDNMQIIWTTGWPNLQNSSFLLHVRCCPNDWYYKLGKSTSGLRSLPALNLSFLRENAIF